MACPYCQSSATTDRPDSTARGYRRFRCGTWRAGKNGGYATSCSSGSDYLRHARVPLLKPSTRHCQLIPTDTGTG